MRLLAIVMLSVVLPAAVLAQDMRVGASRGVAEIELSEGTWLQAVSGRAVPSGAGLATWLDSSVTVVDSGLEIILGELAVARFSGDSDSVEIQLITGNIEIVSADRPVRLEASDLSIELTTATVSFSDGVVTVLSGVATVQRGEVTQTLEGPIRFAPGIGTLSPIIRSN